MSEDKYKKYLEKLLIIKAIIEKFGTNLWFLDDGTLLLTGNDPGKTQKEMFNIIKKNIYLKKFVIFFIFIFYILSFILCGSNFEYVVILS